MTFKIRNNSDISKQFSVTAVSVIDQKAKIGYFYIIDDKVKLSVDAEAKTYIQIENFTKYIILKSKIDYLILPLNYSHNHDITIYNTTGDFIIIKPPTGHTFFLDVVEPLGSIRLENGVTKHFINNLDTVWYEI
jgi:hypothetical protein